MKLISTLMHPYDDILNGEKHKSYLYILMGIFATYSTVILNINLIRYVAGIWNILVFFLLTTQHYTWSAQNPDRIGYMKWWKSWETKQETVRQFKDYLQLLLFSGLSKVQMGLSDQKSGPSCRVCLSGAGIMEKVA